MEGGCSKESPAGDVPERVDSRGWIFLALSCAVLSVYLALRWNLVDIPLNRDEGGFAYLGKMIAQGGTLYRDGCDLKPPGIFFLYAALSYLVPLSARGLHLALQAYNLATLLALVVLAKSLFGWRTSFWTALVFAVFSSARAVEGFAGSAEMFMLLPIVLSFLLAVRGARSCGVLQLFLSGIFSAAYFWMKQSSAPITIFFMAYIFIASYHQMPKASRGAGKGLAGLIWFVMGFCTLSLMVVGYFVNKGTLHDFWYWSFEHPYEYTAYGYSLFKTFSDCAAGAWQRGTYLFRESPFIFSLALASCIILSRYRRAEGLIVSGFLISSFVSAAHAPRVYAHYFALLCPSVALAAGAGTAAALELVRGRKVLGPLAAGAAVAAVVGFSIFVDFGYYFIDSPVRNNRNCLGFNPFPESEVVAAYVRQRTQSSDRLLILGSEPEILLLADRVSATRHIYVYPVVGPYTRAEDLQAITIREITEAKPKYVVLVNMESSWKGDPRKGGPFGAWIEKFLSDKYTLEAAFVQDATFGKLLTTMNDGDISASLKRGATLLVFREKPRSDDMGVPRGYQSPH